MGRAIDRTVGQGGIPEPADVTLPLHDLEWNVAGLEVARGGQTARTRAHDADGHRRTRIPRVVSHLRTWSLRGSGASGTWPTETPYFESGGQIAM